MTQRRFSQERIRCKYWLLGTCAQGDKCQSHHIARQTAQSVSCPPCDTVETMSVEQGCVVHKAAGNAMSSAMPLASDVMVAPGAAICPTPRSAAKAVDNEVACQRSVATPPTSIGLSASSGAVSKRGERHAYSSKVDATSSLTALLSQSRLYWGYVSSCQHKHCTRKRRLEPWGRMPSGLR